MINQALACITHMHAHVSRTRTLSLTAHTWTLPSITLTHTCLRSIVFSGTSWYMLWNLKPQIPFHLFNPCAPELCKPYSLLLSACFAPSSTDMDLIFILDRLHRQWNTKSQITFKIVAEGATSQLVNSPRLTVLSCRGVLSAERGWLQTAFCEDCW